MTDNLKPSLYSIKHSNRDFSLKETWGKNQFNTSFPAALSSFLNYKGFENIYIILDEKNKIAHKTIKTETLYGLDPVSDDIFYSFESPFTPYQNLLIGQIPRVDLVTQSIKDGSCLKGIEIKLTALPDNSTCDLPEDQYGCELVIRPDTIVYLACSIATIYKSDTNILKDIIGSEFDKISDWTEPKNVLTQVPSMINIIDKIFLNNIDKQEPLVMQPLWKTQGKSPSLSDNCLDVFVWTNFAFTQLFLEAGRIEIRANKITRQIRSIIWLFKMLYDYSKNNQINHQKIIDELSYNTKNDKAFSVNGQVTHPYMKSDILAKPRIKKDQIKEIILGGGQKLLSPERRFDAIIFNTPELFNE
jgi:hypothetical protein